MSDVASSGPVDVVSPATVLGFVVVPLEEIVGAVAGTVIHEASFTSSSGLSSGWVVNSKSSP